MNINFRLMQESDMQQMYTWLHTDFVAQFWKPSMTFEEVKAKYSKYITGEKPSKPYIIIIDGVDAGYIQTYYYSDYPGVYYDALEADKYSAGVDLFIGHADYIHKGYGIHIMRTFIDRFVFSKPDTTDIIITPEPANTVSIKMYGKVGFKWYKTIGTGNGEEEYLMRLSREAFEKLII